MIRTPVESSNLGEVGWENGTLEIAFKDKDGNISGIYDYEGVPEEIFNALMAAQSKGSYFAEYIKGHYPYTKVG